MRLGLLPSCRSRGCPGTEGISIGRMVEVTLGCQQEASGRIHPVTSLTTEWFLKTNRSGNSANRGKPAHGWLQKEHRRGRWGTIRVRQFTAWRLLRHLRNQLGRPERVWHRNYGGNCIRNGHGPQRRDSQGYCDALVGQYTVSVHAPKPQFSLVKSLAQHWLL